MADMPNTKKILEYMRGQVNRFVVGGIVNDVEMAHDAIEYFNCQDCTLAERAVFGEIAFKVGTEKEKEINES